MTKRSLVVVCLACPILACGDDDDGSGAPPASQLYEALAASTCDLLRSCSIDDDLGALLAAFATETTASNCAVYFASSLRDAALDLETEIAAGRVLYDAARFRSCLDASVTTCDFGLLSECRGDFHGKAAIDAPCDNDVQCVAGAWCDAPSSGCAGTCRARVELGARCETSRECLATSGPTECGFEESKCVSVQHDTNVAVGGQCGRFLDGPRVHLATCAAGLYCAVDNATQRSVCVARTPEGFVCEADGPSCAVGTVCSASATLDSCTAFSVTNVEGAACNMDPERSSLVFCSLFDRLACVDFTCKRLGDGTQGAFCRADQALSENCAVGLYCAGDDTCQPAKAEGASCQRADECRSRSCTNSLCDAAPTCD